MRSSDYDPSKPDNGYTAESIVWSYANGVDGVLLDPNTARVDRDRARWRAAVVFTDCDWESQRVRIVDHDSKSDAGHHRPVARYERPDYVASTDTASPRDARIAADGSLWIADAGFGQILRIGNGGSGAGDVGSAGLRQARSMLKAFVRLKIEAPAQAAGTSFAIWYSVDGKGSRRRASRATGATSTSRPGRRASASPIGSSSRRPTAGRRPCSRGWRSTSPRRRSAAAAAEAVATRGGAGNSGQSGVYTYPSIAEGGTGTSGTGTGSGSSGSGQRLGELRHGDREQRGRGRLEHGDELGRRARRVHGQRGALESVQGYEVQGEEGVSGVPLRAVEGPQAPEPERPGPAVPVLALVAAGLVVAAAFFVPWPFVAAHMRRITGFDHTRPARSLPFRPLGK